MTFQPTKDLRQIMKHYDFSRNDKHLRLTVRNLKLEKGDSLIFSLPCYNQIFIVLRKSSGASYTATLYPPIRGDFSMFGVGEVILDYDITGDFMRGYFEIQFLVYSSVENLPKEHLDILDSLGDKVYKQVLKPAGTEGYIESFPMTLSVSLESGLDGNGRQWKKDWPITGTEFSGDDPGLFDREDFIKELHRKCVETTEEWLDTKRRSVTTKDESE